MDYTGSKTPFNLFFVGSSGSGRSSTCNMLSSNKGKDPFQVSHDEISRHIHTVNHISESRNLRLIDTPGFGDTRIDENKIDEILKQLAQIFLNSNDQSNNKIHAFVLVVKIDTNYSTLGSDILRLRDLFGDQVFKSLLILPISNQKEQIRERLAEELSKTKNAFEILKNEKGQDFNDSWYCLWDNKEPADQQEYNLVQKIKNLQPYTYEHYLQGNMMHNEKMKIQKRLNDKLDEEEAKQPESGAQIRKTKVEIEEILNSIEDINKSTRLTTQELYVQMKKDINETTDEFLELASKKHDLFHPSLDAFIRDNKKVLRRMETYLQESLKKQEAAEERNLTDLVWNLIKSEDKTRQKESVKELTGLVAKKGAETLAEKGAAHLAKKVVIFGATKICNIF